MEPRTRLLALAAALALLAGGCGGDVDGSPGAAGLRDPYFPKLGNGGYDVQHYALTLAYDPATRRLDATAAITARATQDLSAFNLDLTGLNVSAARVDGAPAAVNRAGKELTLRPRADIDKGQVFRTVVTYSGVPETVTDPGGSEEGWLPTADGALALGEPTGSMAWFPGNHHPSDKATYDITVTVPKGLRAMSNGRLTSERGDGRTTTSVWRSAEPMASYLATVTIGRYETKTAKTASGVPVLTAADPAVAKRAAPLLARIPELLAWQEENFGPYPFNAAGAIVERTEDVGYALETQTRPVFPESAFVTETLVHELAHQWFGDSVSPASWRDMWLNEGFATYAEWLYAEDFEDTPAEESFQEAYDEEENWAFAPGEPPSAEVISDPPVYGRGAMVLHRIREEVGDDTFFEILRGWPKTYRHANASTDDFTAYVEDVAGKDLDEVWDAWLFGDGRPRWEPSPP
ncbi:M1 family metallopeptidase [Streptomyces purpureus]|uniref:Aminopeptidase N n=1 Tax=Streptomyces purpureus TaxID=1951 RepID=A0A918HJS5_9ACTN|nr:M1 family metallopeptidase [Streptomyces purpureus]GGT66149.1 metallopeptidase [Streptomyces purpureus]